MWYEVTMPKSNQGKFRAQGMAGRKEDYVVCSASVTLVRLNDDHPVNGPYWSGLIRQFSIKATKPRPDYEASTIVLSACGLQCLNQEVATNHAHACNACGRLRSVSAPPKQPAPPTPPSPIPSSETAQHIASLLSQTNGDGIGISDGGSKRNIERFRERVMSIEGRAFAIAEQAGTALAVIDTHAETLAEIERLEAEIQAQRKHLRDGLSGQIKAL